VAWGPTAASKILKLEDFEIGESCIGDSRLEIADWTPTQVAVQFELSNLESPMQDFPVSTDALLVTRIK
jgi:hypothetical protein